MAANIRGDAQEVNRLRLSAIGLNLRFTRHCVTR